eukprot:CAMPEP_0204527730 /NCGR_PEP_ID=MMETSP0661-20131031/9139_1 /ASSEMBLY_ACC=CAM_ASM_000606 /TAXON_ID=109239 /ORGANISM="Alexandrium margalefi, Strain AMGDE01CS-322" /LENGTH=474 /DNA_ID=CAMNT_0051533661 /DNA_START=12 /DNA_END=1434 /DNA_ORIENTATION=+
MKVLTDWLHLQIINRNQDAAWEECGGPLHGYMNFRQFVTWTQALGLEYPIGLEETQQASRPCRFRMMTAGGTRCSCPAFQAADDSGVVCKCGHKASMHRSECAQRTVTKFLSDARNEHWDPEREGLVEIDDLGLLTKLQELLHTAHKKTHNWTRDRGCSLHGVNGCSASCSFKHKLAVPSSYALVTAFRNQNADLWQKYSLVKTAITEECSRSSEVPMEAKPAASSSVTLESPLEAPLNEWYLFHGSSAAKCKSICSTNFRLNLAGSGATWKDAGSDVGTPLYGYGIYLAEHVTKSDEYSEVIPPEESFLPVGGEQGFHAVLLCRVMGGRTNVVTTNEIERDKLKSDVFDGPYHSVYGDRVTTLNKPFREIVVYDKDQCYPEFLLVYTRNYDERLPPWRRPATAGGESLGGDDRERSCRWSSLVAAPPYVETAASGLTFELRHSAASSARPHLQHPSTAPENWEQPGVAARRFG